MPIPEGKYAQLANGYRIHYLEQGSGHPVVFLHGSGSGASGHSNFKGNYPFLAANGYRVIVPDHIGYGYSDKPDDVEYPVGFFVECIKQTLDVLGISECTLVGNSLGGAVALRFALDYPAMVKAMVLMAPGGVEEQMDYFTMPGMQIMKEVFLGGMNRNALEQFIRKALVYNDACVDDELVEERWDIFQKQNQQVIKTMKVPNMTAELHQIECPCLCFWGVNEKMMPESGILKLAKGLKHSRMVVVSECGHWVQAEHRDMFNRYTLDFLRESIRKPTHLPTAVINQLGDELYQALEAQTTIKPFTDRDIGITIDDAYYISLRMLENRLQKNGEKVVGKKIGVTSKVVQEMLGVHRPDFGFLTNTMEYANNADVRIADCMIQPRAEAEIGFRLKKDLVGPGVTEQDVLDATDYIMPCFEIVDSRIDNWKIKIQDTIADNASCGVYALGNEKVDPRTVDLPNLKVKVYKNGNFLSEGLGAAVQGNPLTAVAWLANTLGEYGIPFKAGEVILSGSLVPLEPVKAGDKMHMELEGVGTCSINFV